MNGNIIKNMTQDICYIEMYKKVGITISNIKNNKTDDASEGSMVVLDDNGNYISSKMNSGIQEIELKNMGPDENGESVLLYSSKQNYGIYNRGRKSRNLYTYPGKMIRCISNVKERFFPSVSMLDSQRISMEIPLDEDIFSIFLNGTYIDDFSYSSNLKILTLGDSFTDVVRNFNNNIGAITYKKNQTIYGQIEFTYDAFESVFEPISVSSGEFFEKKQIVSIDNYEALSVNNSSDLFEFREKGENEQRKYLINKQNELSFTLYRDTRNQPLEEMVNGEKFRVILYNDETHDFIYYTNCRLKEGVQLTKSKSYDTIQVNLTTDDIFTIYFGVDGYNQGLYGLGLYGNSYRFEVM